MSMSPDCVVRAVSDADHAEIAKLNALVLGPGRFVRAAYRVREGQKRHSPFCRVAVLDRRIIAACRFAPVLIGGAGGALLLGPLAVHPDHANLGYGRRLIREGLEAAKGSGVRLVVLVGDLAYYGRLGFVEVPARQMSMPGPIDTTRLLAMELAPGALDGYLGPITSDAAAAAAH